jgi:hypothetical protein
VMVSHCSGTMHDSDLGITTSPWTSSALPTVCIGQCKQ